MSKELATREPMPANDQALSMIERMVTDPTVDVTKLQALMEMRTKEMARVAEQVFNAAMSTAQQEMRPVSADALNPQTRSKYASYAKLDNGLRPIYTSHGFALSFDTTDSPLPEHIRVLCYTTHAGGHTRTYRCDMPADGKGAKGGDVMTKTHAAGSAMSYGMRYLLKMIFNVAVGEDDDDGVRAGQRQAPATRTAPPPQQAAPMHADDPDAEREPDAPSGPKLTPEMRARLGRIAKKHGREPNDVSRWLKKRYNVGSSAGLYQSQYDEIVSALESAGPLR